MDENKLPERMLDYVDSLAGNMGKLSDDKRLEVAGMFDRLVAGYSSMLAFIRSEKESLDGQFSEDLAHGDANLINPEEVISFGEGLIEFYRNYARVILIELDVITAFKYFSAHIRAFGLNRHSLEGQKTTAEKAQAKISLPSGREKGCLGVV